VAAKTAVREWWGDCLRQWMVVGKEILELVPSDLAKLETEILDKV